MAKKKHSQGFFQCGILQTCDASKEDTYGEVAEQAAEEVGLQKPDDDHFLALFRPVAGSVICDKDLIVNGQVKPWTLGNYITKLHRSPSDIRFGVGVVDRQTASSFLQVWILSYW